MLKEIFHDSLKISKFTRLYGKPFKRDWVAKVVCHTNTAENLQATLF